MSKKNRRTNKQDIHANKKSPLLPDSEFRNVSFIFLGGIFLRFIFFFEIKDSPLFTVLFSDSAIFWDLAREISRNSRWFGEVFYMSPGYTYLLAFLHVLFGDDFSIIRIIQILINSINIIIIYLIGRELFSSRVGYTAAILAAVFSIFIFYSSTILLEVFYTFFISLLILYLIRSSEEKSMGYWFLTGLLLGAAALFRGNILLFFPFLLIWVYIRYKDVKKSYSLNVSLFLLIGTLTPILPVTLNNYLAEKEFVLLTSNAGINFYIGNNKEAPGVYKTPENIDLSLDPTGKKYAERITGKSLSSSEVSDFWLNKGKDYILEDPSGASILTLKKFFLFFDDDENPQSSIMDLDFYARNYSFLLKLPLPGFYFVFLFSLIGLTLSFQKDHKFLLIYFFIFSYVIASVIFFVMGRFRVGITPVLIVFAAYGLITAYYFIRSGDLKKLVVPVLLLLVFISVNVFFIPKYSFSDYDAYISLGNSHFQKQEYDQALNNYRKSLDLKEESGTYVLIGNTLAVKKEVKGAFESYKKALELKPENTLAHFNLGALFVQTGNYRMAVEAFNAAIKSDSAFAEAYRNLAIIYYMHENYTESLLFFEKYLYLSNDNEARKMVQKDIDEIKRKLSR